MPSTPVTPAGYKKLQVELKRLKEVERPKNIRDIEEARAHGDLSENAEYAAAKERQGFIAKSIAELETALTQAQVIDPSTLSHDSIVFGAKVTLLDLKSEEEICYQIVGTIEADVKLGKVSVESPIARALIGKRVGDEAKVATPRGAREFEVLEIVYR